MHGLQTHGQGFCDDPGTLTVVAGGCGTVTVGVVVSGAGVVVTGVVVCGLHGF